SPGEFYVLIEQQLVRLKIPGTKINRIYFRERGVSSARRLYLRVNRGKLTFDLCAAPFGSSFFFSSWLNIKKPWLLRTLLEIPYLGFVAAVLAVVTIRPLTYFEIDSAQAFHSLVHEAVLNAVDELSKL